MKIFWISLLRKEDNTAADPYLQTNSDLPALNWPWIDANDVNSGNPVMQETGTAGCPRPDKLEKLFWKGDTSRLWTPGKPFSNPLWQSWLAGLPRCYNTYSILFLDVNPATGFGHLYAPGDFSWQDCFLKFKLCKSNIIKPSLSAAAFSDALINHD